MTEQNASLDKILSSLKERAKELNCIYKVEEIVTKADTEPSEIFQKIVETVPQGWQYSAVCVAKLEIEGVEYFSSKFKETPWSIRSDIMIQDKKVGAITVYYLEPKNQADEGPFLKEERRLINTLAERISQYVLHNKLKNIYKQEEELKQEKIDSKDKWRTVIGMLKDTDHALYNLIARKMMNFLCWRGVKEAETLLQNSSGSKTRKYISLSDENRPLQKDAIFDISDDIFRIAADNLSNDEILFRIQKWIQEDKSSFLLQELEKTDISLNELEGIIRRYNTILSDGYSLTEPAQKSINVSLIRRFLTNNLDFISIAKDYVNLNDFYEIIQRLIYSPKSHGKIGGKSMGLFISDKILTKYSENNELLKNIKTPKTWYITSDAIMDFIHYNNLEEVIEHKYKDVEQIRQEYPYIVQVFKNSSFPPEIIKGISLALDDFGDKPLIVRSSSLLEDSFGAAFSGKYKSLFLANQGEKHKRLEALLDAIAEVYASVFSPDPIEYRAERGLLDFNEEMGVMIQEVVGSRVGKYWFPTYAGVAFSNNEFRWSPRIERGDGLVRLVPGLGTRAVDRVSDDYPVLIAPGKPGLRVNVSIDDIIRYSPKKIDVINLEKNTFETIEIETLLNLYGSEYPYITDIVSAYEDGHIHKIIQLDVDYDRYTLLVTFERLITNTNFVKRIHSMLQVLSEVLKTPVDIEFAVKGTDLYILQCRPQSYSPQSKPSPIPKDINTEKIIFQAKKYVSNGKVPDITHIVYVDPEEYGNLAELSELIEIGRVVSKLNKLLPKRQFILMGPGRWGSKGDVKLGVSVTYSDINNTAMLIEIAKKKGNYLPDLSFGTHFFQDLVEASIRYLPLYPDDNEILFNYKFFRKCKNILSDLLPEYAKFSETVKVIDVPGSTDGSVLRVLMNAELQEAIAYLSAPTKTEEGEMTQKEIAEQRSDDFWKWRLRMAEKIAENIDSEKFGVKAFYVFGSTKNATAGPSSDIDILIHFSGNQQQKDELVCWLEGWSLCLAEMNFLRTGYKTEKMLDIHFVTDEDIANKQSYALKIGAVTDAAREIPLKRKK